MISASAALQSPDEGSDLPLIVDADTGWGNALNTQRTVRAFARAGAAMLQLEDQTFPKRCGHLAGKEVIPVAEMCGKLRAALDARRSASTLIIARTDALAVEGWNAAVDRAEAYLACGIDALFIDAPPAGIRKADGATSTAAHGGTALYNPGMMPASAAIPLPQRRRSVAPMLDWTRKF